MSQGYVCRYLPMSRLDSCRTPALNPVFPPVQCLPLQSGTRATHPGTACLGFAPRPAARTSWTPRRVPPSLHLCSAYLELQNDRPFFNRKSSLFRGNSPISLHFQSKKVGIYIVIRYLRRSKRCCMEFPSHRTARRLHPPRPQPTTTAQPRSASGGGSACGSQACIPFGRRCQRRQVRGLCAAPPSKRRCGTRRNTSMEEACR